MSIRHLRRLPLEGAPNTRDLGGYPCEGGSTRWGVFLRSSSPQSLTPEDIQALRRYGVSTALDLRSPRECAENPSPLASAPGFHSFQVPLDDQLHAMNFEGDLPGSMSGLYISLMDHFQSEMARIMKVFAEAGGATLFHCAVGKDRTGVAAMLLLKLAGVPEADIVADYSVTEIYMQGVFQAYGNESIPEYVLRSIPDSMWRVLAHLRDTYGNVASYLKGCGVPAAQLDAIREKFVER